ncbi:MAG: hypothetical protein K0S74_989 [Chlamydiales bacterium]|nr:hypothetical protein [Chlamydiales bacterium]
MNIITSVASSPIFGFTCNLITNNYFRDLGEACGYAKLAPMVVKRSSDYVDKYSGPFAPIVKAAIGGKAVKHIYSKCGWIGAEIGGMIPVATIQLAIVGTKLLKSAYSMYENSQTENLKRLEWKKDMADEKQWKTSFSLIAHIKQLEINMDNGTFETRSMVPSSAQF